LIFENKQIGEIMQAQKLFFNLMYYNIADLLNRDLSNYEMDKMEKEYFEDLLRYLKDINTDIESLSTKRVITSDNINSFYAIPELVRAYNMNKKELSNISRRSNNGEKRSFFKALYQVLKDYYENKTLSGKIKKMLMDYFNSLALEYEITEPFEKDEESGLETFLQ